MRAKSLSKVAALGAALTLALGAPASAGNEAEKAARQCAKHGDDSKQCQKAMEKCMRKGVECTSEESRL